MSGNELPDDQFIEPESHDVVQYNEHSDEGSDLATETQSETKKSHVEFSEEQQEIFNKAIGKKTFEMREAERRLESERSERLRIEAELARYRAPVLEVPPMPDPYSDNYEEQVRARDAAIALRAAHNAQQEQIKQAQLAQQHQEAFRKQQELEESVTTYKSNAVKLGIKQDDLMQAAQAVANYGINEDLAMAIIGDEHGALITTYLASNVSDLDRLVRMTPYQAGMYIANEIKPKAVARKPKTSNAPEPVPRVSGNGAPESKSPLLKGVTYR